MTLALLLLLAADPAADPAGSFVDPLTIYPLMGEYVTATPEPGENALTGLQVRPQPDIDGQTAYQIIRYAGGLPGLGWDGSDPTRSDPMTATAAAAKLSSEMLTRITRVSSTMGLSPDELLRDASGGPLDADAAPEPVVLFNADDPTLDAWKDGAELLDGYLKAGAETKADHAGCYLHLEYRIPLQVAKLDTWRGNSGVYFQNRYEVQVLESFGDVIRDNGSGSIYKTHTPGQNLALPPGQWQTLDVIFFPAQYDGETKTQPAQMTVDYNGVPLFAGADVPEPTAGHALPESPSPGPLLLQDHDDPVVYRNVWLIPMER